MLRRSPLETGVAYLPMVAVLMAAAGLSTILVRQVGTRWLVPAGLVIAAFGAVLLTRLDPAAGLLTSVIGPSAVLSFGIGLIIVPTTTAALAGVSAADEGAASGLLNVSLQLGGALGLAVLSSAAAERTTDRLAAGSPPLDALTSGFGLGFGVAAALLAAAAVVALVLAVSSHRAENRHRAPSLRAAARTSEHVVAPDQWPGALAERSDPVESWSAVCLWCLFVTVGVS